eukprot:8740923-Alexandrium_andersonii.AAC.1
MSASLVGSEMCIRDSYQATTANCSGKAPWHRGIGHGSQALARRWPMPVSYTHLTLPTICSV